MDSSYLNEAVNKLRKDGLNTLVSDAVKQTGIPDYIVRKLLGDNYTIGYRDRHRSNYLRAREEAAWHYRLIRAHTNIQFDLPFSEMDLSDRDIDFSEFRIADIGCGGGNKAVQFIENHPNIEYIGIDTRKNQINALNNKFKNTKCRFYHSDVKNDWYNPDGEIEPDQYEFPIETNHCDLVILRSVFTHMRPDEVQNYLSEIKRIIKPKGKAWITWYIIKNEKDIYAEGRPYEFEYEFSNFYSNNKNTPEDSIAYPDKEVNEMIASSNLEKDETVYGYWRNPALSTDIHRLRQDVTVLSQN